MLGHIRETRIELSAATADDLGTQAYGHTVPCSLQPFEETAANLFSRGNGLVTITKQQRQGGLLAECLSEILYKLLYVHLSCCFCFLDSTGVFTFGRII